MVSSVNNINPFLSQQAIAPTQAVGTQTSTEGAGTSTSSGGRNTSFSSLLSGSTSGLNDNITGTSVFTSAQAGKKAGVSGSSFQAIG